MSTGYNPFYQKHQWASWLFIQSALLFLAGLAGVIVGVLFEMPVPAIVICFGIGCVFVLAAVAPIVYKLILRNCVLDMYKDVVLKLNGWSVQDFDKAMLVLAYVLRDNCSAFRVLRDSRAGLKEVKRRMTAAMDGATVVFVDKIDPDAYKNKFKVELDDISGYCWADYVCVEKRENMLDTALLHEIIHLLSNRDFLNIRGGIHGWMHDHRINDLEYHKELARKL